MDGANAETTVYQDHLWNFRQQHRATLPSFHDSLVSAMFSPSSSSQLSILPSLSSSLPHAHSHILPHPSACLPSFLMQPPSHPSSLPLSLRNPSLFLPPHSLRHPCPHSLTPSSLTPPSSLYLDTVGHKQGPCFFSNAATWNTERGTSPHSPLLHRCPQSASSTKCGTQNTAALPTAHCSTVAAQRSDPASSTKRGTQNAAPLPSQCPRPRRRSNPLRRTTM